MYLRVREQKSMPNYLIRDFEHICMESLQLLNTKKSEIDILEWDDEAEYYFG